MSGAQVMFSTSEFSDLMFDLNVKQVCQVMLEGNRIPCRSRRSE